MNMKILVISDVINWKPYKKIFNQVKPEIVLLAGDLISDGFASFWSMKDFKELEKQEKKLIKEYNVKVENKNGILHVTHLDISPPGQISYLDAREELKRKLRKSKQFYEYVKKNHVEKFYEFIEFAGKKAHVLIVKGDHDSDFSKFYNIKKINSIPGCHEISGKLIEINKIKFLGLGHTHTHYLKKLKPLIEKYKNKIDVILCHSEQNKISRLKDFNPKLIVRGHFGIGRYKVLDTPAIFSQGADYSIIEYEINNKPKINIYKDEKIISRKKMTCAPWFSEKTEFELYPWLKEYNNK